MDHPLIEMEMLKDCCQDQLHCPLQPDRCDQNNVVYQADVHAILNRTNSIQFDPAPYDILWINRKRIQKEM